MNSIVPVWNPGGCPHHFVRIDHSWSLKSIDLYLVTTYVFVVPCLSVVVKVRTFEEIQEFTVLTKYIKELVCSYLACPPDRVGWVCVSISHLFPFVWRGR